MMIRVSAKRIGSGPIIKRFSDQRMGANVNGPSLIQVPDWLPNKLGKYYLYFAHHLGSYIRMAYANHLEGPWTIYEPGVLDLSEVPWVYEHIASPDVHVDYDEKKLKMYFHGISAPDPWGCPKQSSYQSVSGDGLTFHANNEELGSSYFRAFRWKGADYAIALGGQVFRYGQEKKRFEKGGVLPGLPAGTRHPAVLVRNDRLWVAWSAIGDCPERIFIAEVEASADWSVWSVGKLQELLRPTLAWEGAELPLEPSRSDIAPAPMNQLRDPAFFEENGRVYLLYSVAGEAGIAIAELTFEDGL